jgi:hypothetical protein
MRAGRRHSGTNGERIGKSYVAIKGMVSSDLCTMFGRMTFRMVILGASVPTEMDQAIGFTRG